jgi:hypothetical protein
MGQQNLVTGTLSDANKAAIIADINSIRTKMPFLVNLSEGERKSLPKMGDNSRAYVQKGHEFAAQNTDKLGADFGMTDYTADYNLDAQLQEVETAFDQLREDFDDTVMALRSDLMVRSNFAYALMKVLGKSSGAFDDMRKDMGQRFKAQGAKKASAPKTAPGIQP